MALRLLLALLLCFSGALAQKKPVTIEAITAARPSMPAQPIWAPDGKRFAYLEEGKIWLYDIPARSKRELVALPALSSAATGVTTVEANPWENRRVQEPAVQWFPSGQELLIRAGGDLFQFRVEAGGWTQITATAEAERDPKVSPDGRRISFRREHDLYALEIGSGRVTRLTQDGSPTLLNAELDWVYPEELDLGTAHWWSPDSRSIAYLQFDVSREPIHPQVDLLPLRAKYEPERYPKAGDPNADVRLGVIAVEGRSRTRWTDVGQHPDSLYARFHWLPDSSGIAVQRLNRIQNRLDLLIADRSTGASRAVLTETDPHWINVRDHFRWLKDGREFLWSSERDGFAHLYRYSIGGQQLAQLTRGEWEVVAVTGVDETAGQVYFVSAEQSPLERHFYRVGLAGGERRRITAKPGTHSVSMGPTAEYYVATHSSLSELSRSALHKSDGAEVAVLREADRKPREQYEILPTEIVEVKAADGAVLYARLIKPAGFQPGKKYPAVVAVYGGPHAQAVRNAWPGLGIDQVLAHRGFVVWQLDNRGSAGRGHRWEAAVFRNLGAKELEDQKEGVKHLVSLGFVDPARIGIHGWSYGGYMTLYALLNAPDVFRAGVSGAPVTDWRHYDTIYTERYMGLPSENEDGYQRSALVPKAANLKGDLLLVHNLEDDNVLVQNTIQMADALQRAGKQFEMMIYPAKGHGASPRKHFYELLLAFFEKSLKQ
ncbi:MAG: S9 family peptidase [Acidobacteriota bacterium]